MKEFQSLINEAKRVSLLLKKKKKKIVFIESCTGGMASAAISSQAGVSEHFCGSFVIYRNNSKRQWLGISQKLLSEPGPVSQEMSEKLALQALKKTKEAHYSFAITGHFGPKAPKNLDGKIFCACALQSTKSIIFTQTITIKSPKMRLKRQLIASQLLLQMVRSLLAK